MRIGYKLKELREKTEVTTQDIADKLGDTSAHYVEVMENDVMATSLDMLVLYCREFNTTPNDLLCFEKGEEDE